MSKARFFKKKINDEVTIIKITGLNTDNDLFVMTFNMVNDVPQTNTLITDIFPDKNIFDVCMVLVENGYTRITERGRL